MDDRIVSLVPSATETLFKLGAGDQVEAVSHACDHPDQARNLPSATRTRIDTKSASSAIDASVQDTQEAGEALFVVLEEVLHHAQPDLIIAQDACSVCGITPVDVEAALARIEPAKRPEILSLHPHTFDDVLKDIERIAHAAGVPEAGEQLLAEMRTRIDRVQERTEAIEDEPRVAVLDWLDPPMAAGHWIPQMVRMAGASPVPIAEPAPSRYLDEDELSASHPDVVVLAPCGFKPARTLEEVSALASIPGWQALPAVQQGRVYALDAGAYTSRPGPRLVDGLEQLALAIHEDPIAPAYPDQAARVASLP